MTGELSLAGIFVPTLLMLAVAALAVTFAVTRLVDLFGLYRFVAYRALVDLSLFVLVLGGLALLSPTFGFLS